MSRGKMTGRYLHVDNHRSTGGTTGYETEKGWHQVRFGHIRQDEYESDTTEHIHTYKHITCSKPHQSTSSQHVVFIVGSWGVHICIEAVGYHRNEDGDNERFFSWSIIRPQTKYRWSYHLAKTKWSNNPAQKTCISCLINLQKKVQCFKNYHPRKVKFKTLIHFSDHEIFPI